jgi:hypothetical protein
MKLPKQSTPIMRDEMTARRLAKKSGVIAQMMNCRAVCSDAGAGRKLCMNICENL